jgi:hypothetical protein
LFVHPNPVRTNAQVQWSDQVGAGRFLNVYDVAGRRVRQERVGGNSFTLSSGWLPNGVYFLRLEGAAHEPLGAARVIVRK